MSALVKDWGSWLNSQTVVMIVICCLLMVYLGYALLRPERF